MFDRLNPLVNNAQNISLCPDAEKRNGDLITGKGESISLA